MLYTYEYEVRRSVWYGSGLHFLAFRAYFKIKIGRPKKKPQPSHRLFSEDILLPNWTAI